MGLSAIYPKVCLFGLNEESHLSGETLLLALPSLGWLCMLPTPLLGSCSSWHHTVHVSSGIMRVGHATHDSIMEGPLASSLTVWVRLADTSPSQRTLLEGALEHMPCTRVLEREHQGPYITISFLKLVLAVCIPAQAV